VLQSVPRYQAVEISAITAEPPETVYNLEVETDECYAVVGGMVVHNCLRYLGLVRPFQPDEPDMRKARLRETLDDLSYREATESADVLSKAASGKYRVSRVDKDLDFAPPEVDLT